MMMIVLFFPKINFTGRRSCSSSGFYYIHKVMQMVDT